MGVSLNVKAFSNKENKEFQKHFNAVKFCIENELSFPKETTEFFEGKIDGEGLDSFLREYLLEKIQNGIEVPLPIQEKKAWYQVIKVSDIPKEVDKIIITIE